MIQLECVHFIQSLRLPTHQSALGELNMFRDAERDMEHPEKDVPCWDLELGDGCVRISIAKNGKLYRSLGGNREKDFVVCVPLQNVAWYREDTRFIHDKASGTRSRRTPRKLDGIEVDPQV